MLPAERITTQHAFWENLKKYPKFLELSEENQAAIVRRIERSCSNTAIDCAIRLGVSREFSNPRYVNIYSAECMRILSNICPETAYDSYLPMQIIEGTIDITKIADMKNEELNPAAGKAERDEIEMRQNQKTEVKVSRMYKCKKCGGNETKPIEYTSRAADEASSRSIKCMNCGEVWRS
jgi:DNA-directed RNA polymerase subunit M/transcription elongation factor TFIIS